jgi:hypothetical protein
MSSGHAVTDPALLAALESQRRLRVEDYHRMVAAGVFEEDERLCDPQFAAVGPDCLLRARLPLTLEPDSEPEPDVAIVRRGEEGDRHRHPSSALAVFEVASDSLRKDRLAKAVLYAQAGIPEYVIVNLAQECLEVHRDPDPKGRRYRTLTTLGGTDRFESASVGGLTFLVADLLA